MDEPVVDLMADLLTAVGTVISNFATWITSMTTTLIANPLVQLLFGMCIALVIYKLIIGLVKTSGMRRKGKRR